MNEQRAREAVEHLQTAALEVIESIRAFLDVVDDLLRDPTQVTAVVNDLADIGRRVATAAAATAAGAAAAADGSSGDDSGVTRIRVS